MWNVTTFLCFLVTFLLVFSRMCAFSVICIFFVSLLIAHAVILPLCHSIQSYSISFCGVSFSVCDQSYKINCNWFCRIEIWYACLIFTIKPIFFLSFLIGNHKMLKYFLTIIRSFMLTLNGFCMLYVCYIQVLVLPEE